MARGVPTTAELVEAVSEFLRDEVLPELQGARQFNTRVALHVLAMVERELREGPAYEAAHAGRLADLGVGSDAELAAAIRDGRLGGRPEDVLRLLRASTRERLAIANPRYLEDEDARR